MNNVPRKKPHQPGSLVLWNGDMIRRGDGKVTSKGRCPWCIAQKKTCDFGAERELIGGFDVLC